MLSSPNTVMINTLYTIYTQCNIHLIQAPLKIIMNEPKIEFIGKSFYVWLYNIQRHLLF